jgi:predicted signal transduction protein with EAL and GGDEF domain
LFALAWMMLLAGAGLLALRNFAIIPSNFLTLYSMQIGSSLEMILLSFALAARFNELKRQREAALQNNERVLEQRVAERTQALEEANQRLSEQAMRDPLTGLANRTALQQHLTQVLSRNQRRQELLAVMLIDLDGFKPINDQYGHGFGDQVLAEVAQRLTL